MKKIISYLTITLLSFTVKAQTETFHDFSEITILHDTLDLSDFAGKKVLVVNTASYCSYTPQYTNLVILDSIYSGPNFAIIGFPCNDFGGQEPYDDSTILAFAHQYNVAFQLMHKISITAQDTAEVYKWLQLMSRNGVANAPVSWNFNKFCIDEAGHWVHHFAEFVDPLDTAITNWITSPNTTGIAALNNTPEIKLAGNPAFQKININVKTPAPADFTIRVADLQGRQVGKIFSGMVANFHSISYEPAKLNTGIYFVNVKS
ncbi:MAG TPA: T9SS type A sorting domain-containing protein, partial [Bacteroidia bacterium]|nr:T9SS type A sorting domain-containing protein [Bacteroidia bacterium]